MTMSVHSELASILNKLEFYPKSVAELYKEASQMLSSGKFSEAADKVEAALKELEDYQEEDKQTWGFAELQLLYGKSLLEIIKCSSNNEEIFGPKVPKVVGLCTNSDEVEEEEESAETDDSTSKQLKGETSGEDTEESKNEEDSLNIEDKEQIQTEVEASSEAALPEQQLIDEANSEGGKQSEEEEQDIRELAWEQLECARVILTSKLPESRLRLAVVYETLGDFGMENDNNEQAADDFKSAVKYYEEEGYHSSRMVGGLYHSIYLALRSVDPNNARKYLKLAADVFKRRIAESKEKLGDQASDKRESLDDEEEILKEIELEIADFDSIISNQEKENSTFQNDTVTQVTRVEPRKRAETNKDFNVEQAALCETSEGGSHELVPNKRSKTCAENENLFTEQ